MEKKNFLFIIMCVAFYLGYTSYLKQKYPNMDKKQPQAVADDKSQSVQGGKLNVGSQQPADETSPKAASDAESSATPAVTIASAADLRIESKTRIFTFDQMTGGIKSLDLKEFREDNSTDSALVNLTRHPYAIQAGTGLTPQLITDGFQVTRSGNTISFTKQIGSWELNQEYVVPDDGYGLDLTVSWKNVGAVAADLSASIAIFDDVDTRPLESGSFLPGTPNAQPTIMASTSGEMERIDVKNYCEKDEREPALALNSATIQFFGTDSHYFQKVLLPETKSLNLSVIKGSRVSDDQCSLVFTATQSQGLINPGQSASMTFRGWFGPKSMEQLEAFAPELTQSVDLGWLAFVARPLFAITHKVETLTGNWGLAIIIVTILLKVLFYPLNRRASVSMKRMNKFKPEMDRIREKYKDDVLVQRQEIMKFMSSHQINPMSGCLPILPQLPVFFAFYRILSTSIELRHAPLGGWLLDLSAADPYYITPVVLGLAQFIQQKLTPTVGMDKAQERMMLMLPVVFSVMMLNLPSGMVLYMLVNTFVSIAQQQWLNRRVD